MKKILNKNKFKIVLSFILGAVIFGSIGVFATNYLLKAEDVEYVDKDNNLVTVQSAITDLYSKASSGGYGELTLGTAEASGNSISVSYGDNYIGASCIYGIGNSYNKVGKIVDNKCVMENLNQATMYKYKIGAFDSSMKIYIGEGEKETASVTYLSAPIEVYYNPVNGTTCTNYVESNSNTGTKTGCMKWYAYKKEGDYYTMLLDHNTTAISYYNYDNNNSVMGKRTKEQLTIHAGQTISYNEIGYDLTLLTTSVSSGGSGWDSSLNPKLITEQEIRNITGNNSIDNYYFNGNSSSSQVTGSNIYAWLFDYTDGCTSYGCNIANGSTSGYWTSSKYSGNLTHVWSVNFRGNLDYWPANVLQINGLRPVITVPSSILNIS